MRNQNDKLANEIIKMLSQEFVPAETVLINRNGTAKKSPNCPNCGSWIRHWQTLSGESIPANGDCAVVGCKGITKEGKPAEIVGCHVMRKDDKDKKVYIAPLCECCNNKADGTELVLSRNMTLVYANVQETCGKLKR